MNKIVVCFCIVQFAFSPTFCQTDSTTKKSKYYFWLDGGGRYSFSDNFHSLIGAHGGLNFSIKHKHFFRLQTYESVSTEVIDSSFTFSDTTLSNRLFDIINLSLLYGRTSFKTKYFTIITSAGISYGQAIYVGKYLYTSNGSLWDSAEYEIDKYNYVGLPINISFMSTTPVIGACIDLYVNIHKYPDYGIALSMLIGKIRDKKKSINKL